MSVEMLYPSFKNCCKHNTAASTFFYNSKNASCRMYILFTKKYN